MMVVDPCRDALPTAGLLRHAAAIGQHAVAVALEGIFEPTMIER